MKTSSTKLTTKSVQVTHIASNSHTTHLSSSMILGRQRVKDASDHQQSLAEQTGQRRLGQHGGGQAELGAEQAAEVGLLIGPAGAALRGVEVGQPGRRQDRAGVMQGYHLLGNGKWQRSVRPYLLCVSLSFRRGEEEC